MRLRSAKSNLGRKCGCEKTSLCSDHGRIMLESSAILNDASFVFSTFSAYFGMSFFVAGAAGAVFGDVGQSRLLLRAMPMKFHM